MVNQENSPSKDSRKEVSVIQLSPKIVQSTSDPPEPRTTPPPQTVATAADFDTAISETGFGRFNLFTILTACVCCFSSMTQTTTMSFIFPRAHCDLDLSLNDKGTLNAVTYIGMICSAVMWGFLSDLLGRRKILLYGYYATFFFDVCTGLSQNFWTLIFCKFCGGFISCGPFAVIMTYMSEITATKYRSRVMILIGAAFCIANLIIPCVAMLILPQDWDVVIVKDYFMLHSWNIFLLVLGLPTLAAAIAFHFLPESPKFLMSRGRNKEAMVVFQQIYNRNNNKGEFPIRSLADEKYVKASSTLPRKDKINEVEVEAQNREKSVSSWRAFKGGLGQMMVIFEKPYLKNCVIAFTIQFGFLWSQNTMRLWLPSILAMITEFEDTNDVSAFELCQVIESATTALSSWNDTGSDNIVTVACSQVVNDSIYSNSITVGVVGLMGFAFAGSIITALGHRNLLFCAAMISSAIATFLYQATTRFVLVSMFSIYITLGSICGSSMIALAVTFVPTQMRTMVVSLLMMFGRTGSIGGNFLFPWLLSLGCFPAFLSFAAILLVGGLLCLTLPKTVDVPLK